MVSVPPTPVQLPANAVAMVSSVRAGHGVRLTKRDFHRALVQASAQAGLKRPPRRDGERFAGLEHRALGELLEFVWVRGQAAEMGIGVRRARVRRALVRIRREAFDSAAQYRHFLRESHYSHRDVFERVEVQILSTRIVERAVAGIEGETARNRAFSKFVKEFGERWKGRTVCAPGYVIERCSNSSG